MNITARETQRLSAWEIFLRSWLRHHEQSCDDEEGVDVDHDEDICDGVEAVPGEDDEDSMTRPVTQVRMMSRAGE